MRGEAHGLARGRRAGAGTRRKRSRSSASRVSARSSPGPAARSSATSPGRVPRAALREAFAPAASTTLDTPWLVLDGELLPWSAKAGDLIRSQYASVGAAAAAALPVAVTALEAAAGRGLDVGSMLDRTRRRHTNAARFREAYARYCGPVSGVSGLRFAPFQILACAEGATAVTRSARLAPRSPGRYRPSADYGHPAHLRRPGRRRPARGGDALVDRASPTAGGEGMVVKPVVQSGNRVQPGIKVRRPNTCASSTAPTTWNRSTTCANASSAGSARWRCASIAWEWRRSRDWRPASRSTASMRRSSPCSLWSVSLSTPGCEQGFTGATPTSPPGSPQRA